MPLSNVIMKEDDRVNVEPTSVAGISAFLGKLWKMVEDSKTDELISWGKTGNTFVIKNQIDFAKTILPNYYKHNNIASFIRQLNMYGFHKIISTTSGTLDSNDNDEIEFTHPCFVRGHPYLLEQIKRKMNNPKENLAKSETGNQFNESIKRVLNDIKNLKGKQEHLGTQLSAVKQENEILWRELSLLRQKHAAQQNVLNKLIRFLVSLAQPSNHGIVKRRLVPLMLKDSSALRTKREPVFQEDDHVYSMKKREAESPGPIIHEIHPSEMLDNVQIIETPVLEVPTESPVMLENEIITSPPPSVTTSEASIPSPEPVPTALLLPNAVRQGNGKRRLQTVYVPANSRQLPTHFLLSQPALQRIQSSPEYLIPDQTDNPLMELVHETVADDPNDYITVVTSDGTEILPDAMQITLDSDNVDQDVQQLMMERPKKKQVARKNTRKVAVPAMTPTTTKLVAMPTVPVKKPRTEVTKTLPTTSAVINERPVESEDFLVNIGLTNPPSNEVNDSILDIANDGQLPLKQELDINVDDIISIPGMTSATPDGNSLNGVSTNSVGNCETADDAVDDVVFDLPHESNLFINKPKLQESVDKNNDDALMREINDCIDNAQNMKIACTDSAGPPTRAYVDDISMQLDTMQSDINSLKGILLQNEGLTVDVNTLLGLFNDDPLDYNMPSDSSSYPKSNDKITGNELISATTPVFDFNELFPQGEWSQPPTPLSTTDSDYCDLNTPQIEPNSSTEPLFSPPAKKIKSK